VTESASTCANCGDVLAGEYCSRCGQRALDLHRPFSTLVSDAVGDVLNLDTRLVRTIRPLMLAPGAVAKDYIAGRRASHVPPLKLYLIAALLFFGLFTVFPSQAPVRVFMQGSPEEQAARSQRGARTFFSLPRGIRYYNDWYQTAAARAMKQPDAFAHAVYSNVPRAFFFLVPVFALFLELLYRNQGYLIDHLVFALYYHAFVFLTFSLLFLAGRSGPYITGWGAAALGLGLLGWLVAYLPIALRRFYGGSRLMTGLKLSALGALYVLAFFAVVPVILGAALLQF
jgi:hypothetical protein